MPTRIGEPERIGGSDRLPTWRLQLSEDPSPEWRRRFLEAIVCDPSKITDEVLDLRHEMANLPGIRESRAAFDAYRLRMQDSPKLARRFSLASSLPRAGFPLRLVWGAKDRFAPVEMGEELAAVLDLELTVLDAGHQAQTDQPELVNRILTEHF